MALWEEVVDFGMLHLLRFEGKKATGVIEQMIVALTAYDSLSLLFVVNWVRQCLLWVSSHTLGLVFFYLTAIILISCY